MPVGQIDHSNPQGGKAFGQLKKQQEEDLDRINREFQLDGDYDKDIENLSERLEAYKTQFMEFDLDNTGDINIMNLKCMMEKLGQTKTHLELKKMIAEVSSTDTGTIIYIDFLSMMLGKKSSVLKLILMFEEKKREKERPIGIPAKRDFSSLP